MTDDRARKLDKAFRHVLDNQARAKPDASTLAAFPVLMVDDETHARRYCVAMLKSLGFTDIHEATDGDEALRMVHEVRPTFVISDVHMLPKDGLTFVVELRQSEDPAIRDTPVIMLTSESRPEALDIGRHLRVAQYIIKPPSRLAMIMAVEKVLGVQL